MGVLSQLKRTAFWLGCVILIVSLLVNYKLFHYTSELKASNQVLDETITSQETTNHLLAERITTLTTQRREAQKIADEASTRERKARHQLKTRVEQLEKELEHEICSAEPIAYPVGWVSGY
ncbi:hypothetical protein [Vibrio crassostreae]|uniref:hypothetical protein n=1 Tax=Vibrio crassostreae TaxID=246167 RepID=UPI00104F7E03|nr:hypothetical protein [Vibrio crassostreae]TCN93960.1 hypothetical protein EDB30_13015 [Vibrio crassostreae]CAK2299800.1 DUF2570 domain-containing protein [Vibrio crassostreae]CAK2421004.1 DUF2570 domain-containing protein [Vibrio crassostreae]CAK2425117.1 DUF2570 domain-containing protein [Vibrio crassostreae]CAK2561044.1 DUF2570 domain-containing protein [Vibrio crassostreae]